MIQYNEAGWVQLICDTCDKQTPYYATVAELLASVNFGASIKTDAGSTSWIYGAGKKLIGPGFQPTYQADRTKHICPACKTCLDGLVYISDADQAKGGHIKLGDPAKTSRDEDYQMNPADNPLFKGTTPIAPRIYPASEPDITHDDHYKPFGEAGEEGTG